MFKSKCEYVHIYNDNYVYLALNYITQYDTETQIVMQAYPFIMVRQLVFLKEVKWNCSFNIVCKLTRNKGCGLC